MNMSILDELKPIFQEVLGDLHIELTETSTARDIPGWDSMAHVLLLAAIEEHFQIRFRQMEVAHLQRVGDLVHLIEEKSLK